MNQLLHQRTAVGKVTAGNFQLRTPTRRSLSYNEREDYVIEYEKKLMQKYRLGFSQLHKTLVVKAAQQEFGHLFVGV